MSSPQQTGTFAADSVKYGVKPGDAFYALDNLPGLFKNISTAANWAPLPVPSPTTSFSISPTYFATTLGGWRIGAYTILTGSTFVAGQITITLPDSDQYAGGPNTPAQVFGISYNTANNDKSSENVTSVKVYMAVNSTVSPITLTAIVSGTYPENYNFSFMVIGQQV